MSQEISLSALVAAIGLNDGANKGFWRIQPRDNEGQWIEMGAEVLAVLRGLRGGKAGVTARYIGPSGTVGKARILVQGDSDLADGVYQIDSHVLKQIKAILPESYVKSQGVPTGKKPEKLTAAEADIPSIADVSKTRSDITKEDLRLAEGKLTKEEKAAQDAGRAESPIADLPGGFESLKREEAKKLIAESGVNPDEFTKPSSVGGDSVDSAVTDAIGNALYGGEAPAIDQLIDSAKVEAAVEVGFKDLKPGDIVALGKAGNKKISRVETKNTGLIDIYVDDYGTERKVPGGPYPPNTGITRVSKAPEAPATPVAKKPAKPVAPRKPKAETPAAPKAKKPAVAATPKPKKAPRSEDVNRPNREDDGKLIAPSPKTAEELRDKKINNLVDQNGKLLKVIGENNKARTIEDPNAVVDGLLEENPEAKIKKDGTVVVERGEFTDTDGKKYIYEVGVQRTIGNQFMERYTLKDAATGEVKYDFYNADYKDSFYGLYGKTSGLTKTRDLLLGRDIPGGKGVNDKGVPVDPELSNYFGPSKNINQRLKYLRKTKDMNNWRLLTPTENAQKFLVGRSRELNKSSKTSGKEYKDQYGNVRRSFVASTFEAIDLRDNELVKERLVQALGRTARTEESINILLSALKDGIEKRYKGTPRYKELQTLPIHLKSFLSDVYADLRARDEVPFVSEDGVSPVKVGDKVRFINNQGDMVVGTVVKLNAGSGKNGGFKDTARVRFGNQTVDNLQTRNMLHTDDQVTDYAPWVRNDEKIKRRAAELGIDFEEYLRRKEDNPEYDPGSPEFAPEDAGSPYLGGSGVEGDSGPAFTKNAEDLLAGDPLYDADGNYLGTVQQIQEVPSADGGEPGIAVQYLDIDGNLQVEVLDRGEQRGPK